MLVLWNKGYNDKGTVVDNSDDDCAINVFKKQLSVSFYYYFYFWKDVFAAALYVTVTVCKRRFNQNVFSICHKHAQTVYPPVFSFTFLHLL